MKKNIIYFIGMELFLFFEKSHGMQSQEKTLEQNMHITPWMKIYFDKNKEKLKNNIKIKVALSEQKRIDLIELGNKIDKKNLAKKIDYKIKCLVKIENYLKQILFVDEIPGLEKKIPTYLESILFLNEETFHVYFDFVIESYNQEIESYNQEENAIKRILVNPS
jgi:hypothetical protein